MYTQAQAKRGEGVYTQQCATCHGDDLKGKEDLKPDPSPSLTGPDLGIGFNDVTLDMLADRIRTLDAEGQAQHADREQVADVVSFILSKNGHARWQDRLAERRRTAKDISDLTAKP